MCQSMDTYRSKHGSTNLLKLSYKYPWKQHYLPFGNKCCDTLRLKYSEARKSQCYVKLLKGTICQKFFKKNFDDEKNGNGDTMVLVIDIDLASLCISVGDCTKR